jgi:hypothetical protein
MGEKSGCIWAPTTYGSDAGEENGWVASTTNMTSDRSSLEPLLETCIAIAAPWPGSGVPAFTTMVP